jgi:bacterial/archaeal transporter family protein
MATGLLASQEICPEASRKARTLLRSTEVVLYSAALPVEEAAVADDLKLLARSSHKRQVHTLISSLGQTLKAKWFWYAAASSICWTGWAFTAKIGSKEIPPANMELIAACGFLLISLFAQRYKTARGDASRMGKYFALLSGVLLAVGGFCLYCAYRTGYNASMITAVTSLYPMITVLCATTFLREKLNWLQVVGLFFAAVAIFILSL